MKPATLSAAIALLLFTGTAEAAVRGGWSASRQKGQPGRIHLQLNHGSSNHGQTMELSDFSGLAAAQLDATSSTTVSFALRREAGTIRLDGVFREGSGGGQFEFAPDPAFLEALRDLGVDEAASKHHRRQTSDERLLSLALLDVSTAFIRSLQAAGYHESLDTYVEMRIFDVTPELIADFRALGMRLPAHQLVAGQIHGVTPEYVERMRAEHGAGLDFDDLVATRIHGATPDFIAAMADLGYGDLDLDDYVAFRIHGVTPDFVEELAELGYRDLDGDDLVAFRIHGVTPGFIRDVKAEGHGDPSPDDLVSMRIHGRRWH
jgi:hypothetical protein